jgi:hypothetical protein
MGEAMHLFSDRFMAVFIRDAQQAAAEPDALRRELQMAALAASALSRLAVGALLDERERKEAAMLVARLVTSLGLDVRECPHADGREESTTG